MASSHHFTHPRQVSARLALPLLCAVPLLLPVRAHPDGRLCTTRVSVLVVNIMCIQGFCDNLNVIYIFDQTCIALKSGWSSTTRMPVWSLVLLPSLPLTPKRHRQADGQLSPRYPPSPSFSSFGAACVKLCGLPPPSPGRNIRLCCLI